MNNTNSSGPSFSDLALHRLDPELRTQLEAGTASSSTVESIFEQARGELAAIATYIPPPLVRQQLLSPTAGHISGEYWDGTVLFADLSGFTALSEQLSRLGKQGAEEISFVINNLFGALVEEIVRYSGALLKFGGDALTAFFDSQVLGEQHATLACRAALALQERMRVFGALQTHVGTFQLQLRIGVHTGRVFAAQVGDYEHIELVVTGRNINRVALAQEIAAAGEVVVSSAALACLDGAVTSANKSGFYVVSSLPDAPLPSHAPLWSLPPASDNIAELALLLNGIEALRPYLPCHLPRRFLETTNALEAGEFRPVTMLFANFFAFSSLLDRLGEDVNTASHALNAYYRRAQQAVHRYGGIVNKVDMSTYGDKLMALFGAPVAHENDPEYAVRAAVELRAALHEANQEINELLLSAHIEPQPEPHASAHDEAYLLHQRIGISSGVVFAGLVGSPQRREYTVMGRHVNLAARLMAAADEGAIMVAPSTRRLVEPHFALRSLEPLRLKGITDPLLVAEVLRPLVVSQQQRSLGRAALVGRERELATLLEQGRAALSGSGRVVALVGEAGGGKSRLIEETLQRMVMLSADTESGIPVFFPYSVECQSYDQNTPYALTRELLRQMLNLDFLEKTGAGIGELLLRRVEELTPSFARFAPLLSDFIGVRIDETPLTAALTPEQRHDRGYELVEALVFALAQRQPLLLIIDDAHWADLSSLELLARLTRTTYSAPLLLLLGYRNEPAIAQPWLELAHTTRLHIQELSSEGSAELLHALLEAPPPPELTTLLDKAQGNPFFIEEVVRNLVEAGALVKAAGGWQLTRVVDEAAIPDSIEGVITARLDRLEERSREVLQVASVVGRRFPYDVLLGVVLRRDDLQEQLGQLTEADLILFEEIERDLAYLFKHALTRDVAYEAILYARRRELHRRVASQIERVYANRIDEQLGVLARHYLLAEDWPRAFEYHLRAGRQAQARYANREAIVFLERALQVGEKLQGAGGEGLPGSRGGFTVPPSTLVELNERLGVIYALVGEYDVALRYHQQALEILQRQDGASVSELARLHHHIARVFEKRAEFETAFTWVEQALLLDAEAQSTETLRCLLLGAGLHRRQGRYKEALSWAERALSRAEDLGSVREEAEALMLLGVTYLGMGNNDRALTLTTRCLTLYREINSLPRLADAHNNLANICYELGQLDEARTHYQAGYEIKDAIGDVYGQAMIANNLGNLLKLLGSIDEAIEQYQRSLAIFDKLGSLYATGVLHMNLGATYLLNHHLDKAEHHLGRSVELFGQAGAEDFLPELERYLAELQSERGDVARARLACELALATAVRLEARGEEAVTRRVYAEILARDGDLHEAWQLLHDSLVVLREVNNRYEAARTLMALATYAPLLDKREEGQASLDEALNVLRSLGARRDLTKSLTIARQHGYNQH